MLGDVTKNIIYKDDMTLKVENFLRLINMSFDGEPKKTI